MRTCGDGGGVGGVVGVVGVVGVALDDIVELDVVVVPVAVVDREASGTGGCVRAHTDILQDM